MYGQDQAREPRLEETKRIARVLRIVQLISVQPRHWTRQSLADEFGLSTRQIDNDLELIRHGLRYELQRAREGYYFTAGPQVRPLRLSVPETLALALAAQQARNTGTLDGAAIAGALARLEDGLPPMIVPYLRRAAGDRIGAFFGPVRERGPLLLTLERAMVEGRKVSIAYRSASRDGAPSTRTIAPYHLFPYGRSWIVLADDSLRGAVRMFNVDRIQECMLTEERYTVPEDFDPGLYLTPNWGILHGEAGPAEDIVVRFTPRAGRWVSDVRWHPSQQAETLPDGSLTLRFHCGVTHELVRWALSYGSELRVDRPDHLRESVIAEARKVLEAGDAVAGSVAAGI